MSMLGRCVALLVLVACGEVSAFDPPGIAEPEPPDRGSGAGSGDPIGDPSARKGVDYSWARPSPTDLVEAGYTFAVRYLSYSMSGKNLTVDEADALLAAGLDVVVNWENAASDALNGYARGASDAEEAQRQAGAVGMAGDRPIYFAVDFDATADQQAAIDDYFDGVASVLGVERTGAYGGYGPIQRLLDGGKIAWAWQTYAWSGGRWDPRAQLRQIHNSVTIAGGECDIDEAHADDFGQRRAR